MKDDEEVMITFLEHKKQFLFQIIQEVYNLSLRVSDDVTRTQFLARTQSADKTRSDYIETVDKLIIEQLKVNPEAQPSYSILNTFDELYCYVKQKETILKQELEDQKKNNNFNTKLPPLQLIGFDGTPTKWPVFYENFRSVIHANTRLTNAEKVQYLIGCLSGKALNVCSGITATSENYDIIWQALLAKYQDTRVQASVYLDQMLQQKTGQSVDNILDNFCSAEAALQRLKIDNLSDFILTHIALSKLDKSMIDLFEQAHRHIDIPKFSDLKKFLTEQSKLQVLHAPSRSHTQIYNNNSRTQSFSTNKPATQTNKIKTFCTQVTNPQPQTYSKFNNSDILSLTQSRSCKVCKSQLSHPLFKCEYFLQQNTQTRNDIVRQHTFCINCLGFHHISTCKSTNRCSICNKKHHSLLHYETQSNTTHSLQSADSNINNNNNSAGTSAAPAPRPSSSSTSNLPSLSHPPRQPRSPTATAARTNGGQTNDNLALSVTIPARNLNSDTLVLCPTASVNVYSNNQTHRLRVFLDTGAATNFITKACCERLNLKVTPAPAIINGIGKIQDRAFGITQLTIHSRFDSRCSYTVCCRVMNEITDILPSAELEITQLDHLQGLPMADDEYYLPGEIDCLIGNELFPTLLGPGKVTSPTSSVVGIETTLGYIAGGRAHCFPHSLENKTRSLNAHNLEKTFFCQTEDFALDQLTQRFWEIENVPEKTHFSPDDEACEKHFQSTYTREDDGTYTVALPFKHSPAELGSSYSAAKHRLLNLEKKLDSTGLRSDYNATIQTYIDQGYLIKVPNNFQNTDSYYIPHRAVYRPDKETSKTRIVLNAGCKTTSGKSLNDLLYVGPVLQNNIFELLLNLRMFSIAISADIEKMYFQVKLSPDHHSFQRILFRFDTNSPIEIYQFNRVCFGVSSSPYLALRVVRQLAADSRDSFPLAAYEAENHMYVDDYVSSVDNVDTAEKIYKEMTAMFKSGGFNLVKWISNDTQLMSRVPSAQKSPLAVKFDDDPNADTKIVGMQWQPTNDQFHFKTNIDFPETCTKRSILSVTARLFDPLGLISPVVAYMKLLIQECFKLQLDWDDEVPDFIVSKWKQFHQELPHLSEIKIPRHIGITSKNRITLIGFADASQQCYGAAIYVRVDSDENSTANSVELLTAKSKVSNSNKTLARLELCAAVLLAKLINSVRDVLSKRCTINKIYAFSDATVTLTWIHSPAYKFHTFVANRIAQINGYLPASHWFHVRGVENPADIVSRPVTPIGLINNSLWFHGPQWLSAPINTWPVKEFKINHNKQDDLQEIKVTSLPAQTVLPTEPTLIAHWHRTASHAWWQWNLPTRE
ncbi:uncharacterized protein LOC134752623 [Cydia strobilella]|uniref:uncharacterized protein LOC134752623 n=1 Tax=Cydia strobilella TaxID=1100964 RepID=UPI003007387B